MANGIDRAEAKLLLECSLNGVPYPRSAVSSLAVCTDSGSLDVRATELVGGSYRRPQVAFTVVGDVAVNTNPILITGLPRGQAVSVATYDSPIGGSRRWFLDLPVTVFFNANDSISWDAGALQFQLGA